MSDVRIYVDEDAEECVVVAGLRNRGIDVLTSTDAGQGGTSDEAQLTYAAGQRRAIHSLNVGDFARLHRDYLAQGIEHYGVIVIPEQRYSIGEKIRRIAALVAATTAEEMMSRMAFLQPKRPGAGSPRAAPNTDSSSRISPVHSPQN